MNAPFLLDVYNNSDLVVEFYMNDKEQKVYALVMPKQGHPGRNTTKMGSSTAQAGRTCTTITNLNPPGTHPGRELKDKRWIVDIHEHGSWFEFARKLDKFAERLVTSLS